jgi:transcription-repair coupling factor (superfamily II helicase)
LLVHCKDHSDSADLAAFVATHDRKILIASDSAGRREAVRKLLRDLHLSYELAETFQQVWRSDARICVEVMPLTDGFTIPGLTVLTERQLYGERGRQKFESLLSHCPAGRLVKAIRKKPIHF